MTKFPDDITTKAFIRQNGFCGLCGKQLIYRNYEKGDKGAWHAHHINGINTDHRLSNCVCLCINEPQNCHFNAHNRNFAGDFILRKNFYSLNVK